MSNVWLDGLDTPKTGTPISSGPFLLARWERGRAVTFVRNARYSTRAAYLDRLVFRFCVRCPDGAEQVQLLRDGEVDVLRSISLTGEHVQELRSKAGITVAARPGANGSTSSSRRPPVSCRAGWRRSAAS